MSYGYQVHQRRKKCKQQDGKHQGRFAGYRRGRQPCKRLAAQPYLHKRPIPRLVCRISRLVSLQLHLDSSTFEQVPDYLPARLYIARMMDPLSVAGLTIAIFDQLVKLGERTAQLIADAKSFDDVCPTICLMISHSSAI
jgi:hypothetical protein